METLAERIAREGPVNELDAVGWIVRLAKKLESLHARGLAHGGVCPAAMKTASNSRLSLGMLIPAGGISNGLEFRSPERMDADAPSATDDTWSTAATLYALITGSSPFVAPNDEGIRKKIRLGTFTPLSSFDVGDDDLQHILDAALNPSFPHRTSNLAAFRQALEGWHPDSKVRELPPMVDDQPEDDDDDARTVMRPVSAADAVRALIAQREQAAVAARASEAPPAVKGIPSTAKQPAAAAKPGGSATTNHGLLEDDDENAKTSMISVPAMAMLNKLAPATVPAPPPKDMMKSAPPPASNPPTGFGMMRASGGAAARAPGVAGRAGAKGTIAGGFTAKEVMQQVNRPPPPVASSPGISRDALLDEGDNDATVMREAPVEVMQQAKPSIAPPGADRKTPVDPISAVVAATAGRNSAAPPAESSVSFASVSLIEEVPDKPPVFEHREKPAAQSPGGRTPAAAPSVSALADLPPPGAAVPTPQNVGLPPGSAFSALAAPSTPGMAAPPPATPAPAPAPLAPAPVAPPPVVAPVEQAEPSALKGLFIGVGLALVIIALAAAAYFNFVKH